MIKDKKEIIKNTQLDVTSARLSFNEKYNKIIGALEILVTQGNITEETRSVLRTDLFTLQTQLNKMEVAYHKVREIAE